MSRKLQTSYSYILMRMKELGLTDLDISHGDILYQLYHDAPIPMKTLAERISRDKSTVTALVKKMEQRNLICRTADPEDGRASMIGLTAKGESYRNDFMRISDEVMEKLYTRLSKEEKVILLSLLNKLWE